MKTPPHEAGALKIQVKRNRLLLIVRHNPRLRRHTEVDVTYGNAPAIAITFESVPTSAKLSVVVRRDSFALLGIERG